MDHTSLFVPKFNLAHKLPYKIAQNVKKYAKKEIQKLLKANIIQKSDSNYAFPVIFAKKKRNNKNEDIKDGKYRMAVGFRLLNEILESFSYPIPEIKDILQTMSGKRYYTLLDLHSDFFQINVRPEDSH